mmetsp:Transcript_4578/g.9067  ORF Transcript_4578/g.9067 Transcript_4578/m.9067 type:complete len:407 (-) Transcript_4578:162-1382(-)
MMSKVFSLAALASGSMAASPVNIKENLEQIQRDGLSTDSTFGRHLLAKSRRVEEEDMYDMSFLSKYSIKFMGCHHVTQWNEDGQGEDNSRIMSKGLVRYRLCPSDSCNNGFSVGCSKHYGEYVVDMVQFLEAYVAWQMEEQEYKCATYRNTCYKTCYESTNGNCYTNCYKKYGVDVAFCANDYNANANGNGYYDGNQPFDLSDYLECSVYQQSENDDIVHYLGPYCAEQGGDVRLGFFTDDTCTIASSYQAPYFEKLTGVEIPYTKKSIISTNCFSCEQKEDVDGNNAFQDYYNYDADGNQNVYTATDVNELCGNMYMLSGKCETNMDGEDVPNPEEGACTYIEGVKALKSDGIIRADNAVASKPASVAIGVFTGLGVLLAGYVFYLKNKIARSRVNLAGASASLT